MAGHDRVEDAAKAITEATGVSMSARTLYALERGEQAITLEHYLAVAITFRPPSPMAFFVRGYREDVQRMVAELGSA